MKRKTLGLWALAGAIALLCVPADAQGPIRIGASLSLTGTYAKLGKYQHEGYSSASRRLNAKGGLLGRKVEFVVYDDQSTPATGVRLYEKLITEDKVDAVMGPYSSPISEAVANVTEKYKKVMVAPLAATTSIFKQGPASTSSWWSRRPRSTWRASSTWRPSAGSRRSRSSTRTRCSPRRRPPAPSSWPRRRACRWSSRRRIPRATRTSRRCSSRSRPRTPTSSPPARTSTTRWRITRQMKELNVNPKMYGVTVGGDLPEFYDLLKQNAEYIYGATQWDDDAAVPRAAGVRRGLQEGVRPRARRITPRPGYAGCLDLPRGGEARGLARLRQGARRAAQARDEDGVRRLQGRPGRLPDRPQDGDCSSGRTARRSRCGRTTLAAGAKAALPDAAWTQR